MKSTNESKQKNIEFTERFLKGKARLNDITPYTTDDYIKCKGIQIEKIGNYWRLAFVRCPKCKEYISIYKNDIDENGRTRITKKCFCGFEKAFVLKRWKKR